MLYLLQFYTFFIFVCLVLSNSLLSALRNYFLITILLLAAYAETTSSIAGTNSTYFYSSVLARSVFIPSAYLYFRNRMNKSTWSVQDLLHLLPFGLLVIAGIVIYATGPEITPSNEADYFPAGSFVHSFLLLLIYITTVVYFLLLLQLFKNKARAWFEQEATKKAVLQDDAYRKTPPATHHAIMMTEQQISNMDRMVKEYLETNKPFLQHRYSLKDLAEGTNIPLHHLSAFINKHYGVNFNDFINRFRVQYCKQKILNRECEQKKLEAIAQESGFSNRNTFTAAFKKVTGINPSEFLKTAQVQNERTLESQEMVDEPAGVPLRYKLAVDQYS